MVGLFFLQGASHMVPMERNMLPSEAINHDTSHYDEELVPDLIPESKLPGKVTGSMLRECYNTGIVLAA